MITKITSAFFQLSIHDKIAALFWVVAFCLFVNVILGIPNLLSDEYIVQGLHDYDHGQYRAAIPRLEVMVAKSKHQVTKSSAYQMIGYSYYELNDIPHSISSYEEAIKFGDVDPGDLKSLICELKHGGQPLKAAYYQKTLDQIQKHG